MNLFKKLAIGLLSTVIVVLLSLWLLTKAISAESIRDYVSSQLSILSHEPTTIKGNISWQLFPQPGIRISKVEIGSDRQTDFHAILDNLILNLRITPLLRGTLVFSEFKVDGFTADVSTDHLPAPAEHSKTKDSKPGTILTEHFAIDRFMLSKGLVKFHSSDNELIFSNIQMGTESLNLNDSSFPLQFKAALNLSNAGNLKGRAQIQFKGSTRFSPTFLSNPLANWQSLSLNGQLLLQDVLLNKISINRIQGSASLKRKMLKITPLTLSLYKGESVGDLNFNFENHQLKFNQTAAGLDSQKLFNDLLGEKIVRGKLDFSLHAEAITNVPSALNLSMADGTIMIKDGRIDTVNLHQVIEQVSQKIDQLSSMKTDSLKNMLDFEQFNGLMNNKGFTPFKLLSMNYKLAESRLRTDSIILQTDKLHLKGNGNLSLTDYSLSAELLTSVLNATGKLEEIQQMLGGNFPLQVKGTLVKPLISLDIKKVNAQLGKYWLINTVAQPVKKLKNQFESIFTR
ncbi:hypothetical protein B1207_03065 [Legionella quinlivanii]|uniref:AsmA domain-containing protein n=1 Tax=Legionella quinlivanii TaxID=45073 RepID=A0A364LM84_9GAMM|nr:AsmA family protein [Legionella quinlivanii]RAP37983.1 hypothetical protein B1207_03065 [Legionella quinlivanii]